MEVVLARSAGFCAGVRRAVEIASEAAAKALSEGRGCATLGPLIHNDDMIKDLEKRGLQSLKDLSRSTGKDIVIPSHGTSREVLNDALDRGLKVVDATCPHVNRLKNEAAGWEAEGGTVVIVGDRKHPEISGVASYLRDPIISEDPQEILKATEIRPGARFLVLAQTTQVPEFIKSVFEGIKNLGRDVTYRNTVCPATMERQEETRRLAGKVDAMIIIGGPKSANTKRLEEIARASGRPTYRVANLSELDVGSISAAGYDRIGITAGASTPDGIIKEVVKAMAELGEEKEMTMAELEQLYSEKKEAAPVKKDLQVVTGKVTLVTDDEVLADVGQGADVHVSKDQLTFSKSVMPGQLFQPGDEITVALEDYDAQKDVQYASKVKADAITAWEKAKGAFESGSPVEGVIVEAVKAGVVVDLGLRAFMPASQIGKRIEDLGTLVGDKVRVKIIELEENRKGAVVSARALLEEETAKQRKENFAKVQVGAILQGVVRKIMPFGAFINLFPGVDGLLHVSEISWQRVGNPSEVLNEGMNVEVKVIAIDEAKEKISLSMKQLSEKPRFKTMAVDLEEGGIYSGTVVKLMSFGAFVRLEGGAEGLVHVSQISDSRVQSPEDVLSVGQEVKVKVLSVNQENGRISLSIKEAADRAEREKYEDYMKSAEEDFKITIADRIRIKQQSEKR
ncbi:MAG TPA: bifunctional 4-hydroxy-3-methylbut-2-enyl diphosphate reductase/30S ribosomal protein S1 [Bacillota bacterium]|nr:bifunctional 4-hydroxy-3-methylbut-2-enyl diphosphate reductase/30S ribosomal protein S1 [Bacillota bacterium]HOH10350.1 bifunctional 4-hydroxy-3-methylbut-2-enyl diphosphate reductase/30S ribosomal protein S1 [Bacillota bacterium]HOY89271.1 bifunctional 4-hydroxy-3-methylbut-2-enyl diphosphate reductase/30S ribosomal protein S1 [Bacillota bacterium]HPI01610.1 bifunctional 4-hydroxy-3-methylbut-2-enyl diphosphate reductase/30S ribosomal protein S1 [Bacillota bacterium]HPM64465.1 bifunctional